jgi:putative SOS response-associated peptidase YedK
MLFARKSAPSPARILRMVQNQPAQNAGTLRISPKPCVPSNPGARRLVLRHQGLGELALTPMRWGLRTDMGSQTNNPARPLTSVQAEALSANAAWRRLLNNQRCIVPADRFFEWRRIADVKTREYCMRLRSGKPMMLAALWNRAETGAESFAYISCPSNALFAAVHERMPVMLDPRDLPIWLDPDAALETLLSLLAPVRESEIDLFPVGQPRPLPDTRQPTLFDRLAA